MAQQHKQSAPQACPTLYSATLPAGLYLAAGVPALTLVDLALRLASKGGSRLSVVAPKRCAPHCYVEHELGVLRARACTLLGARLSSAAAASTHRRRLRPPLPQASAA